MPRLRKHGEGFRDRSGAGALGIRALGCAVLCLGVAAAPTSLAEEVAPAPRPVDDVRLRAVDREPGSWLTHGRDYAEQRYSPLAQIDHGNVAELGLAWSFRTGSRRGLEATPLVVDGLLITTSSWSHVFALDAKTGALRWHFDPKVPGAKGRDACCDVVNRGVAVWQGRVYLGALDGRLIALDLVTGRELWSVQTTDPAKPYTITGAPRVVRGKVIIGNGGADLGVRGYFGAYDAETGARLWRFYTVPRSPAHAPEHPEVALAAATWSKDSMWEAGLGGTVWDAFAYDPELDLLYVGVGNGAPYDRAVRSPGGGDNLFLASILAVKPDTGKLVWHYQTVPGETWDYTATQPMILADLDWHGTKRKVLMQAPKNGFFYVLDRESGKLLSAEPFVHRSWATHVDMETGRPVERKEASWSGGRAMVSPGPSGAHSWHPMAYSPRTGWVYLPSANSAYPYVSDPDFALKPRVFNSGEAIGQIAEELEFYDGEAPICAPTHLTAWDPVAGRVVFRVEHEAMTPAGVLATAGDLVFQATGTRFVAYDARDGRALWSSDAGVGIIAPPISYAIDGVQYVAVMAGMGGSHGGHMARLDYENDGRLLVYRLGGQAAMPAVTKRPAREKPSFALVRDEARVGRGRALYGRHCFQCHGLGVTGSGLHPDLRRASRETHSQWNEIVLGGVRQAGGMASFADVLTPAQALDIQHYVMARALEEPSTLARGIEWMAARGFCIPVRWMTD